MIRPLGERCQGSPPLMRPERTDCFAAGGKEGRVIVQARERGGLSAEPAAGTW